MKYFLNYLENKYGILPSDVEVLSDVAEISKHELSDNGIIELENEKETGYHLTTFMIKSNKFHARWISQELLAENKNYASDDYEAEKIVDYFKEKYSIMFNDFTAEIDVKAGRLFYIDGEFRYLFAEKFDVENPFECIPSDGFLFIDVTAIDGVDKDKFTAILDNEFSADKVGGKCVFVRVSYASYEIALNSYENKQNSKTEFIWNNLDLN
jgi:hypothetical protein